MSNTIFKNQVVIITGASSGIGREMALQLADQGARLVLAARQADKLAELSMACRGRGGGMHWRFQPMFPTPNNARRLSKRR